MVKRKVLWLGAHNDEWVDTFRQVRQEESEDEE